jgi:hypothetical protein
MTELELREATDAFGRAAAAGTVSPRELHDFQLGLQWEVFGGTAPEPHGDVSADDPRVQAILDALQALAVLEPDDPSHPRARAIVLDAVGRHAEAAKDFLLAAERFDGELRRGDGLTGDEDEWAATARFQAARSFALAGDRLAAQSLLPHLEERERAEVEPLLER